MSWYLQCIFESLAKSVLIFVGVCVRVCGERNRKSERDREKRVGQRVES